MTKPRVVSANSEPSYEGRFSQTLQEDRQVTAADGSVFVAPLYKVINADRDPGLLERLGDGSLNRVLFPESGEVVELDLPIVVHSGKHQVLALVIPPKRRHEEIRLRIELLKELELESVPLPYYVLNFSLAIGPFGPEAFEKLKGRATLEAEEERLKEWSFDLSLLEQSLERRSNELAASTSESEELIGNTENTVVEAVSPYYDEADEVEEELTTSEIELIRDGTDELGRIVPLKTTNVDILEGIRDLPHRSLRRLEPIGETLRGSPALTPDTPEGLEELTVGHGHLGFTGGRVALHFAIDNERLAPFLARRPDLFLPLHRLPSYPVISLLLVARDDTDRLVDDLFCLVDISNDEHASLLGKLAEQFQVEVHLYDENGRRLEYLQFKKPLEGNVTHILERARAWLASRSECDVESARSHFCSGGYERIGPQRHNFTKDSFQHLATPQGARLAANMVSYWSELQNTHYLVENRSFPLRYFRDIQLRIIEASMKWGIFLSSELRRQAVVFELAKDEPQLLETLVARFVQTCEDKSCDLDSMARSENWDRLLTACLDLGVFVDDKTTALADRCRRLSRSTGRPPSIELDVEETQEYERVKSISQVSNEVLRDLLSRGGIAPSASRELLGRGGDTNIFHVIEAARVLDDDSLWSTARFLAAGAEHFEPALLIGLGRVHLRTVHLCALALAMSRRLEALPALIELLHDPVRSGKLPMKDILAEYGAVALPYLFDAIRERGATDSLVEVLAMISIDEGAEIIEYLKQHREPVFLSAAQQMGIVRRRLGGRSTRDIGKNNQSKDENGE